MHKVGTLFLQIDLHVLNDIQPRKWKNKQRVLVFCARGVTFRYTEIDVGIVGTNTTCSSLAGPSY